MQRPITSSKSEARKLIALVFCSIVWAGSLVQAQVFDPVEDGPSFEQANSAFARIASTYLGETRSNRNDSLAHAAILSAADYHLSEEYLNVSAEVIFRVSDLSARMPERRKMLNEIAERCYTLESRDTSVTRTISFLHAMSVLELSRADFKAGLLFADSILTFPKHKIHQRVYAGNYTIRGYCNEGLNDIKAAQDDFLKAAETFGAIPNEENRMIAVLEASARSSLALGELDDALEISNEAVIQLKQFETSGKSMDEDYQVYRTHALILSKFNKTFEALEASQKALDIVTDRQELTPIARCNQTIAEVYAALGQREKSLHFFDAAKSTFISHNDPNELLEVLQKESHVLAEMGRYKEAFFMKDRCQSLKDSIASISQAGRILDLRDLQETKRVRHELALAQAEQVVLETQQDLDHNQKIAMALGLAFFVSALILFYFKLTRRKRAQKVLEEMVKERTGSLERKAEELDLNAQALLCSNRELERFAFVASHDLKTPIRNINSFLTLIKRRKNTISKEELAEYIDIAISYGKQLHAIVNDILEFSRIGTDVKDISSEIQLLGFFTGLKTQFTPELTEKNASIEISGHALMKAPQGYLNQIFTNLITNGLKYNESLFPKVKVNIEEKDGQTVSITIADNGIGIEKEYQAQVFEMFKRLHTIDEYEGTGLGLAVCKKVVERLGGTIELESTFGEGSTFIIELPLDCTAASKQETHPMADLA